MERTWQLSSNAGMVKLRVHQPGNGCWGVLENIYREKPIPCSNMGDMLLKLDRLCEELAFPMANMLTRTFEGGVRRENVLPRPELCHNVNAFSLHQVHDRSHEPEQEPDARPDRAVFYIRVLCRQNASLQGVVLPLAAQAQKLSFESGLELMATIRKVLVEREADDAETRRNNRRCG